MGQAHNVLSDSKSQELLTMLQDVRKAGRLTNQDMIRYRREAERHVGSDEHLYRMEWVGASLPILGHAAHGNGTGPAVEKDVHPAP